MTDGPLRAGGAGTGGAAERRCDNAFRTSHSSVWPLLWPARASAALLASAATSIANIFTMCRRASSQVRVGFPPPVILMMKRPPRERAPLITPVPPRLRPALPPPLLLPAAATSATREAKSACGAGRLYCLTLASAATDGRKRLPCGEGIARKKFTLARSLALFLLLPDRAVS